GERMRPCPRAGCGKSACPVRRAGRGNGLGGATEAPATERVGQQLLSAYAPRHASTLLNRVTRMRDGREMQGAVAGRPGGGFEQPVEERPAAAPQQIAVRSRPQQRISRVEAWRGA